MEIVLNNLRLVHPIYYDENSEFKYISDYKIDICLDDPFELHKIGYIKYAILKYNQVCQDKMDIINVVDVHTTELSSLIPFFENGSLDPTNEKTIIKQVNKTKPNFLYTHLVKIDKQYRGKDYSIMAEKMLVDFYSEECFMNFLQPFPTDKNLSNDKMKKGINNLRKHWKKSGYERLGETSMFYRSCINA